MSEKLDTEMGIVSIRMPIALAKESLKWLDDVFRDFDRDYDPEMTPERLTVSKLRNQIEAHVELFNQKQQGQQTLFSE
jgi:hypothetical protein